MDDWPEGFTGLKNLLYLGLRFITAEGYTVKLVKGEVTCVKSKETRHKLLRDLPPVESP